MPGSLGQARALHLGDRTCRGAEDLAKKFDEFSADYGQEGVFEMSLVPWVAPGET